jgi:signal transduction histidine kinase
LAHQLPAKQSKAEASLDIGQASDESHFLLATLPPTRGQRRLAFAVAAVLLVVLGIAIPFAAVRLPRVDAFIPTIGSVFCVNDLITAVLLFSQFSIGRSRALLVLASGYLFAALMAIPQVLTFPGVFAPVGLLGAGLDSAAWIYFFWHFGFPLALLAYVWLKERPSSYLRQVSPRFAIGGAVAIVIGLLCGLTWFATAKVGLLPRLFVDIINMTPTLFWVGVLNTLLNVLALGLLWQRRRSVLDQWLMVVIVALIAESLLVSVFETSRFSLGFYAGRVFTLVTSIIVLVVLIAETARLDARLVRSNMMLRRERDNKLMTLAAMSASISHEVRQPLMAIATNGGTALQFLGHAPPDFGEVRSALEAILDDCHHASRVFDSVGGLFKADDQRHESVDVNEIALAVLAALQDDLKGHRVTASAELAAALPQVLGHRGQLQEVLINLVSNAIEAMDSIKEGGRVLHVRTGRNGAHEISVTVEDSGPGIGPQNSPNLFDPFVTTKPQGMGLGLAVCHTIIERHGGRISAQTSEEQGGARFQFTLPIKPAMDPAETPT